MSVFITMRFELLIMLLSADLCDRQCVSTRVECAFTSPLSI